MNLAKIERLTRGDEDRLRAIRLHALADAPDAFGATSDKETALLFEDWQRKLEQSAIFVATTADGHDVGIALGARHKNQSDTALLRSMWVAPQMRGLGIAEALVDYVVEWARSEGFRRLILDVVESNASAMRLYIKKGFIANGILGALPPPREHIRECQLEMALIG
jgi:GNAT superfamily N-acetyltransferase